MADEKQKSEQKQENKLSALEELGQAINEEVRKSGRVNGYVSFSINFFVPSKGASTQKKYSFLGHIVKEESFYPSTDEAKNKALDDCVNSIKKVVNGCSIESNNGLYTRAVIIQRH